MRYLLDLAVFAGAFYFALTVFHSPTIAVLAAFVVAGAAEASQGRPRRR